MTYMDRAKASIKANVNLWIALWILILVNIMMAVFFSKGFSLLGLIFFCILILLGCGLLKYVAENDTEAEKVPDEVQEKLNSLMEEIKPLCEEIFTKELENIIQPVLDSHRKDFARGLSWLWENGDDFASQVEKGITEINTSVQVMHKLSDEKFQMVSNLKENVDVLIKLVEQIKERKRQDYEDLEECLHERTEYLRRNIQKEKEIFYEYISKLLLEQLKDQEDEEDILEYINIYKLGDQFKTLLHRSIEARMTGFEDSLVAELENFSADIVGRMQKSALQVTNLFGQMEETIDKLINECRGESNLLIKRLGDARSQIISFKEHSAEIMVTLAWQDIFVEKRWQEMKDRLFGLKDHVMENVGDDVVEYIVNILNEEIPGLSAVSPSSETAVIYKALVDAEAVYQVYTGKNLPDIINDGVFALLQFIRPLELMVLRGIRFSEEGNKLRRVIKDEVRSGAYQELFEQVQEQVECKRPALAVCLEEIYPRSFYTFCSNPYVKQKTDNLNQAAWMLFMYITQAGTEEEELYLLVGLLLAVHQLRNKYIQPLKNVPAPLTDESDLEYMRYACYKSVSLLLSLNCKGLVRLNFRF